ncbi:hypothetical protein GCM10022255_089230 [Dactylosporangium darangshiense]|uniref:Uncharacterized protein n=1 Tax=Dactylosporangium darangshiense TaxID=579108 RepID=A0ABP8DNL1_9ACTN
MRPTRSGNRTKAPTAAAHLMRRAQRQAKEIGRAWFATSVPVVAVAVSPLPPAKARRCGVMVLSSPGPSGRAGRTLSRSGSRCSGAGSPGAYDNLGR